MSLPVRQQQLCMRMHSLGRDGMQGTHPAPQASCVTQRSIRVCCLILYRLLEAHRASKTNILSPEILYIIDVFRGYTLCYIFYVASDYFARNVAYSQGLPLGTVSTSGECQAANGAKLSNPEPILCCDICAPRYS